MNVGFNSDLFLRRPMTGIANYCFEMIRAQQELDSRIDYCGFTGVGWRRVDALYLAKIARDHRKGLSGKDAKSSRTRALIGTSVERLARTAARFGPVRATYRALRKKTFSRSMARAARNLDLFHAFNFQPHADIQVPTLPVIYDLSFIRFPEAHPKDRLKSLEKLPQTIACAPLVQTISQFSKNEIVAVYGYPEDRIFVAPPAAASIFRPLGRDLTAVDLAAFDLAFGNYFLAVGTLEPRKNLKLLVAAYSELSLSQRAQCPLVIVGAKGWGQLELPPQTDRLIRSGSLRFVGSVSDAALRSLYEGAKLLLFPSMYEGFGMPVVEAMACGTAVAHSAETSMDEITGDLASRLTATDVQAWTNAMQQAVAQSEVDSGTLRQTRIIQAETFAWRRSAATVLEAYHRIDGNTI